MKAVGLAVGLGCVVLASMSAQPKPDGTRVVFELLKWRNIGPDRGGRSLAAAGSSTRPLEYYFGATGGGLWKTTDGGTTWAPVTDGQIRSSSVGAVAIAESNPDVVYIGMGEAQLRSNILQGDGIYKTVDAGRTWTNLGLRESHAISRVRVDPRDPDRVYVAALGHPWGPNDARGIYRSKDGGSSWQRILFRDARSGGSDLVIDPIDPTILYASLWQVSVGPGGTIADRGAGSGLFKSTDGGDTWRELTRNPGLPGGAVGNIGVAVSPADHRRVYALVDADDGGLHRSDDGGGTWTKVNDGGGLRQRPSYFNRVTADPENRDVVYVLNLLLYRSSDGGTTFGTISPPHVDHHDLWIAPNDARRMINSNDGGGSVSLNGGATWTAERFPTAQLYRVATTKDLPYHVCGAQQDANTICVPSDRSATRSNNPIVGQEEGGPVGYPAGGGESGSIAPDPRDPNLFFATGPQSLITRYDRRLGLSQARDLQVFPAWESGAGRERFPWTTALVFSRQDPDVLFAASQHVWRTADQGRSWSRISPDLSRAGAGGLGGAIATLAPSPHDRNTIWAGSDDGLVHLTTDGGKTWRNVTPPGLPEPSHVSAIEASPHQAGTAYVAAHRYQVDDRAPYLFRTTDFGANWTPIVGGIKGDDFAHVVREDPKRAGLLYAGTDHGVLVSLDAGANWESVSLNLPDVPVVDLVVEENDLVIATHGRSFFVLDDIGPLRQLEDGLAAKSLHLFRPRDAIRRLDPAVIDYLLRSPASDVTIEALDRSGAVIRQYRGGEGSSPATGREPTPTGRIGANRFAWDLRYAGAAEFPNMILWVSRPVGPIALPGEYQIRVTANGVSATERLTIRPDPRVSNVSADDLRQQFALALQVRDLVSEANESVTKIREVRNRLRERATDVRNAALAKRIEAVVVQLDQVEGELYQTKLRSELDATIYPVKLNNRLTNLQMSIETGDGAPTAQARAAFDSLAAALAGLRSRLGAILNGPVVDLDRRLKPRS